MKDFHGNGIKGKNKELDWDRILEVASRGSASENWNHISSARVDSSKTVYWTPEEDGLAICNGWGANSGKCYILDSGSNTLVCTMTQPSANTIGPNRIWMPVYKGRELIIQSTSNNMTLYFIPYK